MPVDEKVLVVSYCGDGSDMNEKVISITGEYVRTEPACFRKDGGGKVNYKEGHWNIFDRLGQQVAWVEGEVGRPVTSRSIPKTGWNTQGEKGFFLASAAEEMPISVEFKALPEPEQPPQAENSGGVGCSELCAQAYQNLKDQLPQHHRDSIDGFEAKAAEHAEPIKAKALELHAQHWPIVKEKAKRHSETAKEKFDEYSPVVKQKAQEAHTACYDFWTHPDTVNTIKKSGGAVLGTIKCCAEGIIAMISSAVSGSTPDKEEAPRPLKASESDQAMDASYVKLDSTTPIIVEPTSMPPLPPLPALPSSNQGPIEPTTLPPNKGDLGDL